MTTITVTIVPRDTYIEVAGACPEASSVLAVRARVDKCSPMDYLNTRVLRAARAVVTTLLDEVNLRKAQQ